MVVIKTIVNIPLNISDNVLSSALFNESTSLVTLDNTSPLVYLSKNLSGNLLNLAVKSFLIL